MKKTYETPTVSAAGDAVRETKAGPGPVENGITGNGVSAGSVGFNL